MLFRSGFVHAFQGWAIFLLSTLLLLGLMGLLNRLGTHRAPLRELFDLRSKGRLTEPDVQIAPRSIPLHLPTATLFALIGTLLVLASEPSATRAPERTEFALFPTFIGPWTGSRTQLEEDTRAVLQADDYLLGTYRRSDAEPAVELFIAYYGTQNAGRRPHSPRVCLPGGGWEIERIDRRQIEAGSERWPVNRVLMRKGDRQLLSYYWFMQQGRPYANEYRMKWHLFVGSISTGRRDGALVRLTTPIDESDTNVHRASHRLAELLDQAVPTLRRHLPGPSG